MNDTDVFIQAGIYPLFTTNPYKYPYICLSIDPRIRIVTFNSGFTIKKFKEANGKELQK